MSGKKSLFLILALALPVGIFLFLKFFGRNEFVVEPLFQTAVSVDGSCPHEYVFPYVIPDSTARALRIEERELTVVVLSDSKAEFDRQVKRIEEEFSNDPVQVELKVPRNFVRKCIFLMNETSNIVLLDKSGSIRGQYDGNSLDEMDRLIVEMKIILKKY